MNFYNIDILKNVHIVGDLKTYIYIHRILKFQAFIRENSFENR